MFLRYRDFGKNIDMVDRIPYKGGLAYLEMSYIGPEVFHMVRPNEVNRLDVISYIYFNTPEYWWVIALYNGLRDPLFELEVNSILRIPVDMLMALDSIYEV